MISARTGSQPGQTDAQWRTVAVAVVLRITKIARCGHANDATVSTIFLLLVCILSYWSIEFTRNELSFLIKMSNYYYCELQKGKK